MQEEKTMLVEKTMEETIKAFLNGNKKTMAAVRMEDGSMRCEYALKSGKRSRGCDVEDCDKYEKGAPVRVKEEP